MSEHASRDASPASPTPDKPAVKQKKKGRWRRRVLWTLAVLAFGLVLFRVAVMVALPGVLKGVASTYGLTANYERSQLNLLSGDAELWHLTLTPKEGGEPIVATEYCRLNLSTLMLLRGKLAVWRVEADGVDLLIERTADGEVPLLERFALAQQPQPEPAEAAQVIDLTPPLRIDAFRLSHVKARVRDAYVQPPFESACMLDVRVSNVGSQKRPTSFYVELNSGNVLQSLVVEGTGTSRGRDLDATMSIRVLGMNLKPLEAHLAPLGLRPVADRIDSTFAARVKASAVEGSPDAISGNVVLENIAATVDGTEAAALDRLSLEANAVTLSSADLANLLIDGVRAHGGRAPDGSLQFAGLQLIDATAAPPAAAGAPEAQAEPAPVPATPSIANGGFHWKLAKVSVTNVRASFDDAAVTPAAQLAFVVEDLSATDLIADGTQGDRPIPITGRFSAPGLARAIELKGTATPFATAKRATLSLRADGIVPEAAKPYLDALGIESRLQDGTIACEMTASMTPADERGTVRGEATIDRLTFADGDDELLGLRDGKISGVEINLSEDRVRVGTIEFAGPTLLARRGNNGVIEAIGFRTNPAATVVAPAPLSVPERAPATAPAPAARQPIALPKLEIGRFVWEDVKVRFDDEMTTPPARVQIADAGVELTNLTLDLDSDQPAAAPAVPGSLRAWLAMPGVAEKLSVEGTVTPRAGALAADLKVSGEGITGDAVKSYLAPFGVEPVLKDGSLVLALRASLLQLEDGLGATLAVTDLRYADGEDELAGVAALRIDGVEFHPDQLVIGEVAVDKPRARAVRDVDGSMLAGGIRIAPPPATQPADVKASKAAPWLRAAPSPATAPTEAGAALALVLKKLRIAGAELRVIDRMVAQPFETTARLQAELDHITLGKADAAPATLRVELGADGVLENMTIDGSLITTPARQGATINIAARGIDGAGVVSYLPPGTRVALENGAFRAAIDALLDQHPDGGHSARLIVTGVELREGESPPLLAMDNATVRVDRFDLPGKIIAIDEISTAGIETAAQREKGGALRVGGLSLEPGVERSDRDPSARLATDVQLTVPPTTTAPNVPTPDAAEMIAAAREALPLVTLRKLDLNVTRFTYTDAEQPQGAPLTLVDLRVRNTKPIELAGEHPEQLPPAEIETTFRVEPLVDSVKIASSLAPMAAEPVATIDFAATGIKGDGLLALAPQLREHLDGSRMTDGSARAHLETHFKLDRRVWQDLDFSRPLEADVLLSGAEFRAAPDGEVLAGLGEVRSETIRVEPHTGAVHVRTIEIDKPIAHVWRDAEGLHVMGLLIKLPQRGEGPGTQPAEQAPVPSIAQGPARQDQRDASAPVKPQAEIRIDKLLISGADLRFEDISVEPRLVVPITSLDVDVRGLSNMALYEDRPIRFNALVGSGKVEMPAREGTPQERDLFAQAAASGRVSLYPAPVGRVKSSVSGLELIALSGPAKQAGVEVGGGVFDSNVDVRLKPENVMDARAKFTFTDLKMSEAPEGPLKRTLQLPAPLDVVIVALQDPSGGINVPLNVTVHEGELSGGAIAGAAVTAFAALTTTAVASAPVKMVGGVTGLVGLGGGNKQREQAEDVQIAFAAGDVALDASQRAALEAVIARMQEDRKMQLVLRHELGSDDIQRIEPRANPSPQDAQNLAYQLRQNKMDLLARRAELAGRAKAELISGAGSDAPATLAQLRTLDAQLAQTEDALDYVLELLRAGANRQAARRTRAASIEVGDQRLVTVRDVLLASGAEDARQRVRVTNAQANPGESATGQVVITLIPKKKR
jgi:hypothetical protein